MRHISLSLYVLSGTTAREAGAGIGGNDLAELLGLVGNLNDKADDFGHLLRVVGDLLELCKDLIGDLALEDFTVSNVRGNVKGKFELLVA